MSNKIVKNMTDQELLGVVGESINVNLTKKIKSRLIECLKELEVRHYKIAMSNDSQLLIVAPDKESLDLLASCEVKDK